MCKSDSNFTRRFIKARLLWMVHMTFIFPTRLIDTCSPGRLHWGIAANRTDNPASARGARWCDRVAAGFNKVGGEFSTARRGPANASSATPGNEHCQHTDRLSKLKAQCPRRVIWSCFFGEEPCMPCMLNSFRNEKFDSRRALDLTYLMLNVTGE